MHSLTKNGKDRVVFDSDLDFSLSCLQSRQAQAAKNDAISVFDHIWRGAIFSNKVTITILRVICKHDNSFYFIRFMCSYGSIFPIIFDKIKQRAIRWMDLMRRDVRYPRKREKGC